MIKILKRYRAPIFMVVVMGVILLVNYDLGKRALEVTSFSIREMLLVIPPIFILLGLLDLWVPRETIIKLMGDNSGIVGVLLAFFIGSAAAGPLYGAFPVAAVLMKKGVKFSNIMVFVGAWSTTKIPMFLFELSALGSKFAITRLLVNIPGIIIIALLLGKLVSKEEKKSIYERAVSMSL